MVAPLVLLALSPGTTRTAPDKDIAPAKEAPAVLTVTAGPAILTSAELEKLRAADPAAWARLQVFFPLPIDSAAALQTSVPVIGCAVRAAPVSSLLVKDGPVTTIVIGPPGLNEQEIRKLQAGEQGSPADR